MPLHDSPFKEIPCLASVDAELVSVNTDIVCAEKLRGLNLFLSPSAEINGRGEELRPALLRHMHHRSAQIPTPGIRKDAHGGVYRDRRLKGAGLYSGPKAEQRYRIRNIARDATGLVLGLQAEREYEKSLENSRKLRQMGIAIEIPEGAFRIKDIIFTEQKSMRMSLSRALDLGGLPAEYKDIPFVIRVDAFGVNHRLKDFIFASKLLPNDPGALSVRTAMIQDAIDFLKDERKARGDNAEATKETSGVSYCVSIVNSIVKNVALLHREKGIHGQLTPQNLTLDGRFVDYDTLTWHIAGEEFDYKRQLDLTKLMNGLSDFVSAYLGAFVPEADVPQECQRILGEARSLYENVYDSTLY